MVIIRSDMVMSGRTYSTSSNNYRYSINGQEKSDELGANTTTALYWEYDGRIGRRWNVDPADYGNSSGYESFGNNPLALADPLGLDTIRISRNVTIEKIGGQNDLHSDALFIPSRTIKTTSLDFNITPTGDSSKDVFTFTENVTHIDEKGNSYSTAGAPTTLNPYDQSSAHNITYGKLLVFDGLFTLPRGNEDWETIAKFMDASPDFKGYMLNHNPASQDWLDKNSSMELMEGLMPAAVQAATFRYLGDFAAAKEVNAVEQTAVHGNSLKSLKPTWGYKLYSSDGTFLKNGITSELIPESRYTKSFMSDKIMQEKILFPNRKAAWDWEFQQNQILRGPLNLNMH